MQAKLIVGADALVKFIDSIASKGKKLDGEIQIGALSAAAHFEQHGDVTYINRLFLALGKGARHAAMTAWLTTYAGVSANTAEGKKNLPFLKDSAKTVNLDAGAKKAWFLMKPSKAPDDEVDVYALTLKVIAKAKAEGKTVINEAMVVELEALAEKFAPVAETTTAGDADPLSGAANE